MHTPTQARPLTDSVKSLPTWAHFVAFFKGVGPLMIGLIGLGLCSFAFAQKQSNNFLLYTTAGTSGLGLGLAKEMRNGLVLRTELSSLSKSIQSTQDGVDYQGKIQLASTALFADLHPFDSAFHITTGVNIKPTAVTLGARSPNGLITLNGQAYPLSGSQGLNANISFPNFMPYLGLGWGFAHVASFSGFGFNTDLGFDFGKMNANLTPTAGLINLPGFKDNVNIQSQKLNASVSGIRFFPIVKFQVGYAY